MRKTKQSRTDGGFLEICSSCKPLWSFTAGLQQESLQKASGSPQPGRPILGSFRLPLAHMFKSVTKSASALVTYNNKKIKTLLQLSESAAETLSRVSVASGANYCRVGILLGGNFTKPGAGWFLAWAKLSCRAAAAARRHRNPSPLLKFTLTS